MKTLTAYISEKMVFTKKNVNKGNYFDLEIKPFEEAYDLLFKDESIEDIFFNKYNEKEILFIDKDGKEQSLVYDIDKNEGDLYFIGKVGTNWITRNKKIPVITDVELQKYEAV